MDLVWWLLAAWLVGLLTGAGAMALWTRRGSTSGPVDEEPAGLVGLYSGQVLLSSRLLTGPAPDMITRPRPDGSVQVFMRTNERDQKQRLRYVLRAGVQG